MSPIGVNTKTWLSGHVLLMGVALIVNIFIVGYIFRYHQRELVAEQKAHHLRMTELESREHKLKQEIIALEGVQTWDDTGFVKSQVK